MKIVIEEARAFVNAEKTGIGKFYLNTLELLTELGYSPICYEKSFLLKDSPLKRRIKYFIWLNTVFLYKLWKLHDDVIVFGVNYYIPFIKIPRIKYYPVVHDIMSTKKYKADDLWRAFVGRFVKFNAIRNGDRIITVSQTSKKEIAEYYGINENKIDVVYNGLSLDKNIINNESEILKKYNLQKQTYLLSVSSMSKHKNIKTLIDSFNTIKENFRDLKLVLVGNGQCFKELSSKTNENIVFTGFIEEDILKILYKNAKAYVFPSVAEGFGIPIIDAQNFEIPVICSDIPIFKEIATEKGALFFEPTEQELTKVLTYFLQNTDISKSLIEAGKNNIKRFSKECRMQIFKNIIEGNN